MSKASFNQGSLLKICKETKHDHEGIAMPKQKFSSFLSNNQIIKCYHKILTTSLKGKCLTQSEQCEYNKSIQTFIQAISQDISSSMDH
ncbi:hypothetical protein QL285_005167 [Trifolium repens]|nr:hypothetical protein QL285_005167 [Trifolium repens]